MLPAAAGQTLDRVNMQCASMHWCLWHHEHLKDQMHKHKRIHAASKAGHTLDSVLMQCASMHRRLTSQKKSRVHAYVQDMAFELAMQSEEEWID